MLRNKAVKINVWKALILAGLFTGYAVYGLTGQSKQQERVRCSISEGIIGKSVADKTKGPDILLRSIFNLLDN